MKERGTKGIMSMMVMVRTCVYVYLVAKYEGMNDYIDLFSQLI